MKKSLKIILIIVACVIGIGVVGGGIAFGIVSKSANMKEYKLGDDTVKSINAVVNKRKVVSVSSSTSNGVKSKSVEYKSSTAQGDLMKYVEYLVKDEGFVLTKDIDLSNVPATAQLGKESKDAGQILIMTIDYTNFGYTITLQKGEGTLTRY